jgi:[ribosomal protein S5]-alanine N-acetyltransferase
MDIKLATEDDAIALSRFYIENQQHLQKWEPCRPAQYHSEASCALRLQDIVQQQAAGQSAYFILFNGSEIIGLCSLTNIIRGPFQACYMGFAIASQHQGKGLMPSLCAHAISFAFTELGLNRIMANYLPTNLKSKQLLHQLGFVEEGMAKKYLQINGIWEDHILSSLLNPNNI